MTLRTPGMVMNQSLSCASATQIPRLASCMRPVCDTSFSPRLLRCSPPASPSLARLAPTHAHAHVWNPLLLFVCTRVPYTTPLIRDINSRRELMAFFFCALCCAHRGALFGGRCTTTLRWKKQHSWQTTSDYTKRTWNRSRSTKSENSSSHSWQNWAISNVARRTINRIKIMQRTFFVLSKIVFVILGCGGQGYAWRPSLLRLCMHFACFLSTSLWAFW